MKKLLLAAIVGLGLSGCALLGSVNSGTAAAVQGGIEFVTAFYIVHKGGSTATGEAAVAQKLTAIATQLEGVVSGDLTVAQFNAAMATYLAKLDPLDRIIAAELLQQIDAYFAAQLGNGSILTVATKVAATAVLNDIIAASALYLTAPSIKRLQ
jgi:hypothetical protein